MDKTIRRNEICNIGLPRCDFVFSSTRTCFIAYGFTESPLEMNVLRKLLEERGIQAEEAGGALAPAQNAFCAKICSKIITSQFCIVLLNNESKDDIEIPNANVNMEYGLMLGFNKFVIPFQRASQELPFNVAGLDTVKYMDQDFERLARSAIDQAIMDTQQDQIPPPDLDQYATTFLMTKRALLSPIDNVGDRILYNLGRPLGFSLLNDFSGMHYIYFGNFSAFRPEVVLWRLETLREIIDGRRGSLDKRVAAEIVEEDQVSSIDDFFSDLEIWVVVTGEDDKRAITEVLEKSQSDYVVRLYSREDVLSDLEKIGKQFG